MRRLLIIAAGLGLVALAAVTFVLSFNDLRELAVKGGAPQHYRSLYPVMIDGLVVVTILSLLMARQARWWSRWVRWLLLLLLIIGSGAAGVRHAVKGYDSLPKTEVSAGVAAAPWAILLVAVWLWLTMFKHAQTAPARRTEASLDEASLDEASLDEASLDGTIIPGLADDDREAGSTGRQRRRRRVTEPEPAREPAPQPVREPGPRATDETAATSVPRAGQGRSPEVAQMPMLEVTPRQEPEPAPIHARTPEHRQEAAEAPQPDAAWVTLASRRPRGDVKIVSRPRTAIKLQDTQPDGTPMLNTSAEEGDHEGGHAIGHDDGSAAKDTEDGSDDPADDRAEDPDGGGERPEPDTGADAERWSSEAAEEARRWAADVAGRYSDSGKETEPGASASGTEPKVTAPGIEPEFAAPGTEPGLRNIAAPLAEPENGIRPEAGDEPAAADEGDPHDVPTPEDKRKMAIDSTPPSSKFRSSPTPPGD